MLFILKVTSASVSKCQGNEPISLTNFGDEGYISSFITQKTSCGDSNNPWLLTADIGQRINITLIDFVSDGLGDNNEKDYKCIVYGTIRDESSAVTNTVCGGSGKKIVPAFLSASNIVEIRLVGKAIQFGSSEGQFLLKYISKYDHKYLLLYLRTI